MKQSFVFTLVILHAETLIVVKKHWFEFWMEMLFQNTDTPRNEAHSEMYNYGDRERDDFFKNCIVVLHGWLH